MTGLLRKLWSISHLNKRGSLCLLYLKHSQWLFLHCSVSTSPLAFNQLKNRRFVLQAPHESDSDLSAIGLKSERAFQGFFRLQMFTQSLNHRGECEVCWESVQNMPEVSGYPSKRSLCRSKSQQNKKKGQYENGIIAETQHTELFAIA